MTSKLIYKGGLRTEATHILSGTVIETDAPPDNNGLGERFSPTDLVATALAACMCTLMGISARTYGIDIDGMTCDIVKIMASNPRRIGEIQVKLHFPRHITYNEKQKKILELAAMTCPVMESIHPDIRKTIDFDWL